MVFLPSLFKSYENTATAEDLEPTITWHSDYMTACTEACINPSTFVEGLENLLKSAPLGRTHLFGIPEGYGKWLIQVQAYVYFKSFPEDRGILLGKGVWNCISTSSGPEVILIESEPPDRFLISRNNYFKEVVQAVTLQLKDVMGWSMGRHSSRYYGFWMPTKAEDKSYTQCYGQNTVGFSPSFEFLQRQIDGLKFQAVQLQERLSLEELNQLRIDLVHLAAYLKEGYKDIPEFNRPWNNLVREILSTQVAERVVTDWLVDLSIHLQQQAQYYAA